MHLNRFSGLMHLDPLGYKANCILCGVWKRLEHRVVCILSGNFFILLWCKMLVFNLLTCKIIRSSIKYYFVHRNIWAKKTMRQNKKCKPIKHCKRNEMRIGALAFQFARCRLHYSDFNCYVECYFPEAWTHLLLYFFPYIPLLKVSDGLCVLIQFILPVQRKPPTVL